MQERQEHLDDDLVGDCDFDPYRFPGVQQRSSALNLLLADIRVRMQIHVQVCETFPLDLTPAQQRMDDWAQLLRMRLDEVDGKADTAK